MTNPLHTALSKKMGKHKESSRDIEIRETNEKNRLSNMTPVWKDRHNRRHGKESKYNHSKEERGKFVKEMSKDS